MTINTADRSNWITLPTKKLNKLKAYWFIVPLYPFFSLSDNKKKKKKKKREEVKQSKPKEKVYNRCQYSKLDAQAHNLHFLLYMFVGRTPPTTS